MDWKLILSSFIMIFIAELGDKTQIASMGLATKNPGKMVSLFIGIMLGFIATTMVALFAGGLISRYIPDVYVKYVAGFLLIGSGIWIIVSG